MNILDPDRCARVLVVEDESLIRLMLAEELEMAGASVVEAASADEAILALADGARIDAVVTDIRMPGSMDGIGLCRWMAQHMPTTPVLVTTGMTIPVDRSVTNPAIVRVIRKPYKPGQLAADIIALVSERVQGEREDAGPIRGKLANSPRTSRA